MTNKDILRCMALSLPVKSGLRKYQRVLEYSIRANENGTVSCVAGVLDEAGVLKEVSAEHLTTDAVLPKGLPKIVWDSAVPIEEVMNALRSRVPAGDGRFTYAHIGAIKMVVKPFANTLHYVVQLRDKNRNTVQILPKNLVINYQHEKLN